MSTTTISNPAAPSESKSAKKKKAKAEAPKATTVEAPQSPSAEAVTVGLDAGANGADGNYESPYMKELYK